MVPAEFVKFKHGLCKSFGTECFEGIMLEPCLLQPCFQVAGARGALSVSATANVINNNDNNNSNNIK